MQQRLAAAGFGGGTNDRAGGIGRPTNSGEGLPSGRQVLRRRRWKAWEFDFKVSARAADAIVVEGMEMAEIEWRGITAADFSELEDPKWDGLEDKSRQIYDVLCMLTSGEAKSVSPEVLGGDGIAAWQALAKSFARRTLASVLGRYREVMESRFC